MGPYASDEQLCRRAAAGLAARLGCDLVAIYLIHHGVPRLTAASGPQQDAASAWQPGRHDLLNAALLSAEPAAFLPRTPGATARMCVPVAAAEQIAGLVLVEDGQIGRIGDAELELVSRVADDVALSLRTVPERTALPERSWPSNEPEVSVRAVAWPDESQAEEVEPSLVGGAA